MTGGLEDNWQAVRAELDGVLRLRDQPPNFQDLSPVQAALTSDDLWKTYFFYAYGYKATANCARCPRTTRVLDNIPGLTTAFFSLLGPHKHLPEHRGPYKGGLRCHLALLVPEPARACGIRVADQTAHWQEGKCLLFDEERYLEWERSSSSAGPRSTRPKARSPLGDAPASPPTGRSLRRHPSACSPAALEIAIRPASASSGNTASSQQCAAASGTSRPS